MHVPVHLSKRIYVRLFNRKSPRPASQKASEQTVGGLSFSCVFLDSCIFYAFFSFFTCAVSAPPLQQQLRRI